MTQRSSHPNGGGKGNHVAISDVVGAAGRVDSSSSTLAWLAELLRDEGVDLMDASDGALRRGTPVYVHADADVVDVQRRMAQSHIRRLPVVKDDQLVGIVDLLDLARIEDLAPGEQHPLVGDAEEDVLPPLGDPG